MYWVKCLVWKKHANAGLNRSSNRLNILRPGAVLGGETGESGDDMLAAFVEKWWCEVEVGG